jgi:hypothetical protein
MRSETAERRKGKPHSSEIDKLVSYLSYAVPDVAAYDATAYFLLELCINTLRERRDCGNKKSIRSSIFKN